MEKDKYIFHILHAGQLYDIIPFQIGNDAIMNVYIYRSANPSRICISVLGYFMQY